MKKIEEYPISFKTAKLAKEKGFKQLCNFSYDEDGVLTGNCEQVYNYVAPTQSLLQKWLREEHNLYVIIELSGISSFIEFHYRISGLNKYGSFNPDMGNMSNIKYDTYEIALEKGLIEALNLIEKKY